MASTGTVIYGSDYNAVQVKVREILGDGSPLFGSYGWNQTLSSGLVTATNVITQLQWNQLASDINTAYIHQNNANYAGYATISGTITYANLALLDGIISPFVSTLATRTVAASAQLTETLQNYPTIGIASLRNQRSVAWSASITGTTRIDFTNAATMQYFFNQGGKIRILGLLPTNSGTAQDTAWRTFLATLNKTIDYTVYATLSGTPINIVSLTYGTVPYATNTIVVSAYISGGSLFFTATYNDAHTASGAGPDSVSAGAGYDVYVTQATSTGVGGFTGYTLLNTSANTVTFG